MQMLQSLQEGDLVQLLFVEQAKKPYIPSERLWVLISAREDDNFVGVITNGPKIINELQQGDTVVFKTKHIAATMREDLDIPSPEPYIKTTVIVTKDVLRKREFNFMLRAEPFENNAMDSGWMVLNKREEQGTVKNIANFVCITMGELLNIDDSIISFIEEPPYCAYTRGEDGAFYKIKNYNWDNYFAN